MILALKLWLGWHLVLAVIGLALRAPHAWWQAIPGGSGFKIKLGGRFWPLVEWRDGWLGVFADVDRRRFYVFLCPFFGVRIDLARRKADAAGILRAIFGEPREEARVRALTNEALSTELCNRVWGKFAMGSRPGILVGEAMDRLRSLPSRSGIAAIARERLRQIQDCDFGAARDARYVRGELARAAACYALPPDRRNYVSIPGTVLRLLWPWPWPEWKPGNRQRELEKAGALCAAEWDRLERLRLAGGMDGRKAAS